MRRLPCNPRLVILLTRCPLPHVWLKMHGERREYIMTARRCSVGASVSGVARRLCSKIFCRHRALQLLVQVLMTDPSWKNLMRELPFSVLASARYLGLSLSLETLSLSFNFVGFQFERCLQCMHSYACRARHLCDWGWLTEGSVPGAHLHRTCACVGKRRSNLRQRSPHTHTVECTRL